MLATGTVAVVTGGSRGIGRAVVDAFAQAGATVFTASRGRADASSSVYHVVADLSTADGVQKLVDAALEHTGQVHVLVNNVGRTNPRFGGFLEVDDAGWAATLELNLMAAVRACRGVLPSMVEAGAGCIINVLTVNAREPDALTVDYAAAKAALANLTKALSAEFAPSGVRVNAITPGPVDTAAWRGPGGVAEQLEQLFGQSREELERGIVESRPIGIGRFGRPEEIAAVALFLASTDAAFVTGADWVVDGGFLKQI